MSPPKLTLQTIKDRYEKNGYIILSNTYTNNKTPLDVYDVLQGKKIRLTTQELDYRSKHWDRGEFDFMNIMTEPLQQQPQQPPQPKLSGFQLFLRRMQDSKVVRDASEAERLWIYQEYQSL